MSLLIKIIAKLNIINIKCKSDLFHLNFAKCFGFDFQGRQYYLNLILQLTEQTFHSKYFLEKFQPLLSECCKQLFISVIVTLKIFISFNTAVESANVLFLSKL